MVGTAGRILLISYVTVGCVLATPARSQESTTYRLERVTVVSGGGASSSPTYDHSALVAQSAPPGSASACNLGSSSSFGFWSVLGDLPLPIVLGVWHSELDPAVVELAWSGATPGFRIYRGSLPLGLAHPDNLYFETGLCDMTDSDVTGEGITYYLVTSGP